MKFAENNRISHRQLYRQMVLAFLSPFLLCLFGKNRIMGINGILGTAAALVALCFYVIFLIRLGPFCADLKKTAGKTLGRGIGLFFTSYVVLSGAYLLSLLAKIVPESLVTGISGRWISLFAVLVCMMGTHRGMQRRGRIGEVSGGWILGAVLLLLVLSVGQGKLSYLQEMPGLSSLSGISFLESTYGILCAFSGIGLLPFALGEVEKQGSSGKTVALAIVTLGGILLGMQLLLVFVFGWDRLKLEPYPVLPLLSGANLPGNVLARFDVLWMAVLLYGFLFSIGSLLHYGNQLLYKASLGTGHYWLAAVMYVLSFVTWGGVGIEEYYLPYLGYVFVPGLLLIQIFLMSRGKGRYKKRGAVVTAVLLLCFGLAGCTGVEPEKRIYPLALGFDAASEELALTYGMADLPQATGQEKASEEGSRALTITGRAFQEIESAYNRSQEKYLDLGHLEILVLGKTALEHENWKKLLAYLEQEPFVGENVYVFLAENAGEVLKWSSAKGTSAGEYLTGILENRVDGQQRQGVTLREVIHQKDKAGELLKLPYIQLENKELQVLFE